MAHPQEAKKGQVKVDAEYLKQIEGAHKELHYLLSNNTQFAPILLRLSFHDAGTYDARTKTGGVNGSIRNELSNPPNNGVINAIDFCETVKAKFPKVTYADLYQLAGIVAVEVTGGPKIHFVPGRPDALQQQDTGDLPNPTGGKQHLKDIFHRMGFSDKDIVVLSGSHTLGRAHQERSGFDGPFTRQPFKFDNSYYRELLKGETPELIKFPTDNALLADPVFRGYVELYANDERAFFRDYAVSHKKMSELGFHPNHHSNPHQSSQQQHCPQQNQQHCPQQNQQQHCPQQNQQQQQCVRPCAPCGYYASS